MTHSIARWVLFLVALFWLDSAHAESAKVLSVEGKGFAELSHPASRTWQKDDKVCIRGKAGSLVCGVIVESRENSARVQFMTKMKGLAPVNRGGAPAPPAPEAPLPEKGDLAELVQGGPNAEFPPQAFAEEPPKDFLGPPPEAAFRVTPTLSLIDLRAIDLTNANAPASLSSSPVLGLSTEARWRFLLFSIGVRNATFGSTATRTIVNTSPLLLRSTVGITSNTRARLEPTFQLVYEQFHFYHAIALDTLGLERVGLFGADGQLRFWLLRGEIFSLNAVGGVGTFISRKGTTQNIRSSFGFRGALTATIKMYGSDLEIGGGWRSLKFGTNLIDETVSDLMFTVGIKYPR